jgi:hypothetical protein
VDNVFLHERLNPVEMLVVIQLGVVSSEHVDLRSGNTRAFQLLFNEVQIIQVVAYEITPQHFHIAPPRLILLWPLPLDAGQVIVVSQLEDRYRSLGATDATAQAVARRAARLKHRRSQSFVVILSNHERLYRPAPSTLLRAGFDKLRPNGLYQITSGTPH